MSVAGKCMKGVCHHPDGIGINQPGIALKFAAAPEYHVSACRVRRPKLPKPAGLGIQ